MRKATMTKPTTGTGGGPEIIHNDLIHEVEESLRQERIERLWKEYGPYIIAGVVLAVLLTGIMSGWRTWQEKTNMAATTALITAFDGEASGVPAAVDKIMPSLKGGQRAAADLTLAGMLMSDGKAAEALKRYQAVASDKAAPDVYRDLAELFAVRLEWSMKPDKAGAEGFLKRLAPMVADDKNPWRGHARIQAALIAAHALSDYFTAQEYLNPITRAQPSEFPPSLKERAKALEHLYALQQVQSDPSGAAAQARQKEGSPE